MVARDSKSHSRRTRSMRLNPDERAAQIVQKAIVVFSETGFGASTRELAVALGVTQPLLYRYFPSKEALIERVCDEVFVRPWKEEWQEWLSDRSRPIGERLRRYFKDYATYVTRNDSARLFMFAGLHNNKWVHPLIETLKRKHFILIAQELRHSYRISDPPDQKTFDDEIELIWATHSSIYYLGVRKWIYGLELPKDLERVIDIIIDGFLLGAPVALRTLRGEQPDGRGD